MDFRGGGVGLRVISGGLRVLQVVGVWFPVINLWFAGGFQCGTVVSG